MIGLRKLSFNVGVMGVACLWMGAQAFGDPGDVWGLLSGYVQVDSYACTGVPGASESGSTTDSVTGTHGSADQYGTSYSASLGNSYYNVTCGSNVDEQEVADFSLSSTTAIDWPFAEYLASYELLKQAGGTSTTTVYVKYRYTSIGDSHGLSYLEVKKNGVKVLSIQAGTDEVVVKDASGTILESYIPNQNYYNHNFLYEGTYPLTFTTGDILTLDGYVEIVATEDGADLSTLDVDVSTIEPN